MLNRRGFVKLLVGAAAGLFAGKAGKAEAAAQPSEFFEGKITSVETWDHALSAAEVVEWYEQWKPPVEPIHLPTKEEMIQSFLDMRQKQEQQPTVPVVPRCPISFAAWNVELTEKDIRILRYGTVPIFIRPDNLIEYRQNPIGGVWFAWRRSGKHEEKSTWYGRPTYGHYPGHLGYFSESDFALFKEPVGHWKSNLHAGHIPPRLRIVDRNNWGAGAGAIWCTTSRPPDDWILPG